MPRRHGVTVNTPARIVLGPGAVYKNYDVATSTGTLYGATRGGSTFTITRSVRRLEIDGTYGPVKDTTVPQEHFAQVQVNLIEVTETALTDALAGATGAAFGSTHRKITPSGSIPASSYISNVAIIAEMRGKNNPLVLLLKNALGDQGLTFSLPGDGDSVVLQITWTAHYDPSDLDSVPYEIYLPEV